MTYRDRNAAQFFLCRSDTKGSSAWNKNFVFFKAHVCAISRGGVLAHCRGFGTCGWTDVGDPSTRSRLWDPLPWRHDSRERPQLPDGCPSTLARGVGQFRFGPTWSPVLRISAHRHPVKDGPVKDGEGGPRAGLGCPGQTSRQRDAKSSAILAGPSLLRARARLKRGAGPQWGNPGRRPGVGGLITSARRARPGHPRRGTCPTGLAPRGLSGWIRITGGHTLRRATRAAQANVQHWPGSDSDESHLDARLGRQPHL